MAKILLKLGSSNLFIIFLKADIVSMKFNFFGGGRRFFFGFETNKHGLKEVEGSSVDGPDDCVTC